jgi:hypothetical protein
MPIHAGAAVDLATAIATANSSYRANQQGDQVELLKPTAAHRGPSMHELHHSAH